ncbi:MULTISPECIES: Holliday junction branch migration protein RuvA [unclassified Paenibacillus]|uniref:Holliday junction branch migration protein RuvA n=1 Tax=unclassified Paenibacillus TaxID=185978 RepID=UPI00095514E0|nr:MULTISPECIES: Holliday junction branch migration protein RuvA [unclassified Paenibacillus]ASS66311.1 Holliday junction branch migration protein RuvA [Paenibacillus sp. RUD330]SIQ08277.1 Holliday junction DNA helicase subunit RuvA [Paenibacillus sp. RU4X]SIQ28347.1 Holliday junction DNA helicase subunit RuvA [Paenibacillus sp. RU4T]
MIDFVKGRVAYVDTDYIVVDVRDVGYQIYTPNPYAYARGEEPVTVYCHHHVREDAAQLFGFQTREEQALFRKLLEVSGIGPRVAVGILAGGRPEAVISAIHREDLSFLTRLPGIGKKTAQRMILDLKDKLQITSASIELAWEAEAAGGAAVAAAGENVWGEAREALGALGYTASELDRAWAGMGGSQQPGETVDALMKRALQQLFKG